MLNGRSLNLFGLNAAVASAALVLVSSSFTAEATVTGVGTQNGAMAADFAIETFVVFSGDRKQYAHVNMNGGAVATFVAFTDWNSSASWQVDSNLQPLVYQTIQAAGGFDVSSNFIGIANDKLGNASWSASSTPEFIPTLSGALSAAFTVSSTFTPPVGIPIRQVDGAWTSTIDSRFEPTYFDGVTTYHEAYSFMDTGIEWDVQAELNILYITEVFTSGVASFTGSAIHTHGARGAFTNTFGWDSDDSKTAFPTGSWVSNTGAADFTAIKITDTGTALWTSGNNTYVSKASQEHVNAWAASSDGTFVGAASLQQAADADFSVSSTISSTAIRNAKPTVAWGNTSSWASSANQMMQLAGDLTAGAAVLAAAARLTAVPAPLSRRFVVSNSQRYFVVSGGSTDRVFEVST